MESEPEKIVHHSPYVDVLHGNCSHKIEDIPDVGIKWSFQPDHFQRHSFHCISQNQDVLVTAHTGSGKTAVAKYAIAHCIKNLGKRVVYTSPIKALSNQKYKELKDYYEDEFAKTIGREVSVGLMTGDNKINPDADCVVMTTEILRNALYDIGDRGSTKKESLFEEGFLDKIGCVIFDEVHYINDNDRGHIWEETLIMLDKNIILVMLSATIDKAEEFAHWLGDNRKKIVNLTPTTHRVVPLEHFIWTNDKLYKLLTDKDQFLDENYDKASYDHKQEHKVRTSSNLNKINLLVDFMKRKNMLQAILFSFSRKNCAKYALSVTTQLVTPVESHTIDELFGKYMHSYESTCCKIAQYNTVKDLARKGIAFHHSGLLPILKDIVEILFQKGLIKILFATETFAVGVNMPTRTIVFTELEKYSDCGRRFLHTQEYKQMAGRAGRRGLDVLGNVLILPLYDFPYKSDLKSVMLGKLPHITSRFSINKAFILKIIQSNSKDMTNFIDGSLFSKDNIANKTNLELKLTNIMLDIKNQEKEFTVEDTYTLEKYRKFEVLEENYKDMGMQLNKSQSKEKKILLAALYKDNNHKDKYQKYTNLINLKEEADKILFDIQSINYVVDRSTNDLVDTLKQLGYINPVSTTDAKDLSRSDVTVKGIIAAQIDQCNSLILTEMIVGDMFQDLEPAEICALLAIFIDDIKGDDKLTLKSFNPPTDKIGERLYQIQDIIDKIIAVEKDHGVNCENDYELFYDYIEVAYLWASGKSFSDVTQLVDTYEGNFIRSILKINNIAQDVTNLTKIQGNLKILPQLEQIEDLLVRDLVTVSSLYL